MRMKSSTKEAEKMIWDSMRSPTSVVTANAQPRGLPKLMLWLIFFVSVTYVVYTLKLVANPNRCTGTGEGGGGEEEDENPFSSMRRRHNYHRISTAGEGVVVSTTIDHKVGSAATELQLQQLGGVGHRTNNIALPTTTSLNIESSGENFPLATTKNELIELFRSRKSKSSSSINGSPPSQPVKQPIDPPTNISHIVFGIGASSKLWAQRKNYIKIWYKPKTMRGVVWLDTSVPNRTDESLPELRISNDTSKFAYKNKQGHRSAIRISRIISETLRLGLKDVRWFVLGDDDTVFVTDNLVRVLSKYDHNQYYYLGSSSESHLQNIFFSYAMAYGGGGFAISYPLAVALEKMQDRCIQRYPGLYGSDDRMQACMAELGVPLTKELGFHQYDVYGNLFGLLAAHPVAPLVSLHHLDVVEPIFPDVTRVEALRRLTVPMGLDSAGLMQQSICYDSSRKWTISVSWGFAVQIIRGVLSPREMEMPTRTFLNWYKRADYTAYAFNTRPVARNPCQKPFVFYLSKASMAAGTNRTVTKYVRHRVAHPLCKWKKIEDPSSMELVTVNKRPDPQLWERSPRRNCCRVVKSKKQGSTVIDVGLCNAGEVTEV